MKKDTKGFSLIELLIVVAIILIIAAIAVPNLLRSRIAANQSSAVQSLRTINTSQVSYATTFGVGYSATLSDLGPAAGTATATAAGLIDEVLAGTANTSTKSGYSFVYAPSAAVNNSVNGYTLNATPLSNQTGTNYYYTDQTMVIRVNSTAAAAATDPPIGN